LPPSCSSSLDLLRHRMRPSSIRWAARSGRLVARIASAIHPHKVAATDDPARGEHMEDGSAREVESSHATFSKAAIFVGVGLGAGALIYVLIKAQTAFALIAVSAFLAAALNHAVDWLCGRGLRRGVAIAAVMGVVVALMIGALMLLVPPLVRQGEQFVQRAPEILQHIQQSSVYQDLDQRFGLSSRLHDAQAQLPRLLQQSVNPVLRALSSAFAVVAGMVTIFVLTVFMLVFGGRLVNALMAEALPAR